MSQDQPPRNAMEMRAQQRGQRVPQEADLSPKEIAIMAECRSDSFYYRALPLGLAFGTLTQAGIASGRIMAVGTAGKVVRIFAAGTLGYVLGKASYAGTCKQKFLDQAPDSNISRMLRGEQPLPVPPQNDQSQQDYMVSMAPGTPQPQQQQQQPFSQLTQPQMEEHQDDAIDRDRREGTLSYDQLRNQHRQRNSQPPSPPPPPVQQPSQQAAPKSNDPGFFTIPDPPLPPPSSPSARGSGGGAKNKYGDEGFE